jgi:hypothetical protein
MTLPSEREEGAWVKGATGDFGACFEGTRSLLLQQSMKLMCMRLREIGSNMRRNKRDRAANNFDVSPFRGHR